MSYTIAIIEDEKITLDELMITIPWKDLSLSVVGTASDGISGEALIKKEAPDIVLTDIRLPGQDGLEMLSKCPVDYAVILSGYTDFSYAKRAIQLGVVNYLEKPCDDDELIATLAKITKELDENNKVPSKDIVTASNKIELPSRVPNHLINLAIDYIMTNYNKQIGLWEISQYTRTSENHLSTLFREVTGINFLQYLNAYRINKAIELLENTNMNVSEVAENTGFPTPSYFTKIFKRFISLTPSQYRDEISSVKSIGTAKSIT